MALIKNINNKTICLDCSNESGSIIESKVYYNGSCIVTLDNLKNYYGHLIDNLRETDLMGIHYDDRGIILIYKSSTVIVVNFDKIVKSRVVINPTCYRRFQNNKIMCHINGIAFVDETIKKVVSIRSNNDNSCSLPVYDFILNIYYSARRDRVKVRYLYNGKVMVAGYEEKHSLQMLEPIIRDCYNIVHKNEFIYICKRDQVRFIIRDGFVYKINIETSYINKIVNIFGNVIFTFNDGQYYYCVKKPFELKKTPMKFKKIDTNKYDVQGSINL